MIALEIVAAPAPAWVQDAGRPGRMVHGVPPGGALVPERLAAANRAVGNAAGAAAIEAFGALVVAARGGDLRICWGGAAAWLPRDHVRVLAPDPGARVAYLAVAGGLDVPLILGGRGLLPVAGIGGGFGRPLRAGDRLGFAAAGVAPRSDVPRSDVPATDLPADAPIRVVRGPDAARFAPDAWETLLVAPWHVGAASDRVGVRLVGPPLGRVDGDRARSAPMVQGALQVPAGGAPIVLGPDHPTTGGYPVLGVAIRADLGALFVRAVGSPVRFVEVGLADARRAAAGWRAAWS